MYGFKGDYWPRVDWLFYKGTPSKEATWVLLVGGGGGGFFLACEILGECSTIYSLPALLLLLLLKWKIARAHAFNSLCQDHSTVAQQPEATVAECFLTSCV